MKSKDSKPGAYPNKSSRVPMALIFVVLCGISFYLGGIYCPEKNSTFTKVDVPAKGAVKDSKTETALSTVQMNSQNFPECGIDYQDYTPCTDPKEDIKLMTEMGLEAYRFSISWSRLLPNGRGAVNPKGLKYYNDVINELAKYGIQTHVTFYHLDLRQILEDEYGGWLSPKIIDDFRAYADVCFREFGDRVRHWTTVDEPNVAGQGSYDTGMFPPQRCSYPFGNCSAGNSTTELYIATHNFLLAHAEAYHLYKTKYQVLYDDTGVTTSWKGGKFILLQSFSFKSVILGLMFFLLMFIYICF